MKKKVIVSVLIVALLLPLLSFAVFAADEDGGFWDIVDSIWNSARGILDGIGDFFSNLIKAIGNAVNALLNGIKRLFIPHDDYFPRFQNKIFDSFNKKFGGIIYISNYLKNKFSNISSYKKSSGILTLKFPKGTFFVGNSLNLLSYADYFFPLIRSVLTGFVTLLTVAFCYQRVRALIKN